MQRIQTWQEVEVKLAELGIQPAPFMRRCDLSESTYWRGVKNGSRMQPSVASVVNRNLRNFEQEARSGEAATGNINEEDAA